MPRARPATQMSQLYSFLFWLDDGSGVLNWLLAATTFAFSIWMAVDCWRRGADGYWIWFILVFQPVGAIVYFFTQFWDGSRLEYGLWQRFTAGGRIRDAKARAHHLDTSAAFEELGDLYSGAGKWKDAEGAYRAALQRDAANLHAQVRLGYALIALDRADEAWTLLGPVYQKKPDFDDDKLIRHLARCQAMRGNFVDACNLYEYFLRKHSYTEVQLEYAKVLLQSGQAADGRKALEELIRDAEHAPKFQRRRDSRWVREAKRLLKS